jgi:hypothetical protein
MLRASTNNTSWGFLGIAVRCGMTFIGSSVVLLSLGMASGIATPLALALTALDVA